MAEDHRGRPRWLSVFLLTVLYLLALLAVAIWFVHDAPFRRFLLDYPTLRIAWWGAVGGALANFETIARTGDHWNRRVVPALVVRPVTAAFFGVIGYVIYVTLVQASVSGPDQPLTQLDRTPTALGYVIAFVLGFREQTFRELLQRVTDLLASAGGADVEPPSAPSGLTCRPHPALEGDVGLFWGHATDNIGVTAYNVYRDGLFVATVRLPEPEDATPADSPVPAPPATDPPGDGEPQFIDREAGPGVRRYAVTALDKAGNESDAAGPISVWVTRPGEAPVR
jgi:hypothetical protein